MKKTILYRLFGCGSIPKKLRPVLSQEGLVVFDEGIGGRFITKHVRSRGKRYHYRREGFSGCLAVTKARVICCTYGKRQINISSKAPRIVNLYVDIPEKHKLSLSFESSNFREAWEGIIEFQFHTDKALLFRDALTAIGAQQGTAAQTEKSRR